MRDAISSGAEALGAPNLDRIIIATIKRTLKDIFGKRVTVTINKAMKLQELHWNDVPKNSKRFSELLNEILGQGHVIVEDLILENLYGEMGLKYDYVSGYEFHNYLENIRSYS